MRCLKSSQNKEKTRTHTAFNIRILWKNAAITTQDAAKFKGIKCFSSENANPMEITLGIGYQAKSDALFSLDFGEKEQSDH